MPSGVIEIKSIWNAKLIRDVRRVCRAIRATRRIRWGLVASVYAFDDAGKPGDDLAAERANNHVRKAKMVVADFGLGLKRHRSRPRQRGRRWLDGAGAGDLPEISLRACKQRCDRPLPPDD